MVVAQPLRPLTGHQIGRALIGQQRDGAVQQGRVDELPLAGFFPVIQGGQHAVQGILPGRHVGHGGPHLHGRHGFVPDDRHQAAFGLDQEIVAGAVLRGPRAAITRYGAINQPRVVCAQLLISEAVFFHGPAPQILDQDVGCHRQIVGEFLPLFRFQVDHDAFLVSVRDLEIGAFAVLERRAEMTQVVALRAFDLDHLGAQVTQDHGAPRPGQNAGKIENANTGERPGVVAAGRIGLGCHGCCLRWFWSDVSCRADGARAPLGRASVLHTRPEKRKSPPG